MPRRKPAVTEHLMPPVTIGRRLLATLAFAVLLTVAAQSRPAHAAENQAVIAPIQGLCDSLVTVMKAGTKTPFSQRFDMLAPAVDRALDIGAILQVSIGSMWSTLTPDQHAALLDAFRRYTINSYLSSFDSFNGQRFEISPDLRTVGANQIVQTKIVPTSGASHALDYVMRQTGADWKAIDVLAEGSISRVATQRSDFRSLVMRGGSDALLASLQKKAADLASKSGP
jgi:phospholipid transport system substrate-binding protein